MDIVESMPSLHFLDANSRETWSCYNRVCEMMKRSKACILCLWLWPKMPQQQRLSFTFLLMTNCLHFFREKQRSHDSGRWCIRQEQPQTCLLLRECLVYTRYSTPWGNSCSPLDARQKAIFGPLAISWNHNSVNEKHRPSNYLSVHQYSAYICIPCNGQIKK